MGKDIAEKYPIARRTFDEADEALGYKLSQLCFEGPEEKLRLTEITRAGDTHSIGSCLAGLDKMELVPTLSPGTVWGNIAADVAAGTIDFSDAVENGRMMPGKYMQEAVPLGVGAMAAILGMDAGRLWPSVHRSLSGRGLQPADVNSPDRS